MFALKGFSESDFDVLRKNLVPREVIKNDVVIEVGQPALTFYLVEQGSVKIVQRTARNAGDDVVLGAVKGGGFFGEEALLRENTSYLNTAVALENTVLLGLNREGLQKLMAESISVGTKLLLALSRTYREALATPEKMARILTFYAPKGGVGCTSLAVNTAVLLATAKKKVAFLDGDLQFGNANLFVGAPPNLNVARLVQKEERLTHERIKLFLDRRLGLEFLYAPDLPHESELVSRTNFNQILGSLGPHYDFIILDTPQEINDLTLLSWDLADTLVLVSHPDLASLTRMHRLLKVLNRLNYPKEKFTLLVNRFRESHTVFLEEFRKLDIKDLQTIADDPATAEAALFAGEPFVNRPATTKMVENLKQFTTGILGGDAVGQPEKGGIFSRIRSMFGS